MKLRFRSLLTLCGAALLALSLSGCAKQSSIPVVTPPPLVFVPEDITSLDSLLADPMKTSTINDPDEMRTIYNWVGAKQLFWNLDPERIEAVEAYILSDSDVSERFVVKGVQGGPSFELSPGEKQALAIAQGGMKSLTNFAIKEIEIKKEVPVEEKEGEKKDDKAAKKTETIKEKIPALRFSGSGGSIPAEAISVDYASPEDKTSFIADYSIFSHKEEKERYEPIGKVFFVFVQSEK